MERSMLKWNSSEGPNEKEGVQMLEGGLKKLDYHTKMIQKHWTKEVKNSKI